MKYFTKKKLVFFFILLILLVGFYLRLMKYLEFNYLRGDEGNHFILFDNLIRFNKFWLVGEASSLGDYDLKYYLHNSPYSLYFELIIFILANQSPLIYIFLYILLNLGVVYLLWQINKNFFDERTGLITLFLASFSKHMISISVFASQPTNALIFETVGLYLLSLFYKKKRKSLLIFSLLSFLLALHMYPPMHLYLPMKIIFILIIFYKQIKKNKKILIYSFLIIIITYSPMIINEINYFDQTSSNLWNIRSLINNGGFNIDSRSVIANKTNHIIQLIENIRFIFRDSIGSVNNNFYYNSFFIYPLLLIGIYLTKNKNLKLLIYYFLFSIITPILILSIFQIDRLDYIGGLNSFYFVLLIAISISSLKKISNKLGTISIFLIIIFIINGISFKKSFGSKYNFINFLERHKIIEQIFNEININSLDLTEIDIKVLNNDFPNDNGNWDSSIYWYLIQERSSVQLVESSYPFLTPKLICKEPKITFYICEYANSSSDINDCSDKINFNYDYFKQNKNQVISENKRLILIKSIN